VGSVAPLKLETMLTNLGIKEFKLSIGAESLDIVKNPKTGKLFASASNGSNYKVEQALNTSKPMVVLIEDGDLETACIINQREGGLIISL
jgi:hypothetical protein